jgi:hypothetical protein
MPHLQNTSCKRAILSAVAILTTLTAPTLAVPSALAREAAGGLCLASGTAAITPGISALHSHAFAFVATVRDTLCRTSDPSVKSGKANVTGTGWGNCLGFTADGTFTTTWSNGRKSHGTFSSTTIGLTQTTKGRITSGEFSGLRISEIHILTGPNPLACLSTNGLISGSFDGTFRFSA